MGGSGTAEPTSLAGPGPKGPRVGFITTLAIATGVGPLLLHGLNAMSPLVIAELDLTRTQFGSIATTAFIAGALASGLVGSVADRMAERVAMYVLYVGAAVALGMAALSPGFAWLFAAVVLAGVVIALSNPVTNRLVARYTPLSQRGIVMGLKQAGVQMGQVFAGLVLPATALVVGWRGSLGVAVVLAIVGLALSVRYVPLVKTDEGRLTEKNQPQGRMPTVVWWLGAYAFLSGFAVQGANTYFPLYGYDVLGLPSMVAGALTAVLGFAGLVARIAWGQVVSSSEAPRRVLIILALVASVGLGTALLAELVHPVLIWIGAITFGGTAMAANVVLMVTVLRVVGRDLVGRATGAVSIGIFLGFAVGPVTFGGLVDGTGDYRVGWSVLLVSFLIAGLLAVLRRDWGASQP